MDNRSGLLKAGTILLLVGGILQAVGAVVLVLYGAFFAALVNKSDAPTPIPALFTWALVALGAVGAIGCLPTFLAYGRAKAGDPQGAFVRGLVGSLLPPLQVVTLIGAILCKVSPEGEGHAPQAWQHA
ncbi:MAG TPA: hypothetical protein VM241_00170 [Candidatus Thermoplasmatota archaeon]|nr:hypothetical protein [Candidatus Thermoplasmatota archaeon]